MEGLRRKLQTQLSPTSAALQSSWEVGDLLASYWRPNFETMFYPYVPPHITKPKECKKLYLVPLPEKCYFAVPKNIKLLAVPLFELYDNVSRYGPIISALPMVLSRYRLNVIASAVPPLPAPPPGSGEDGQQQQQQQTGFAGDVKLEQQQGGY